ncbi:MAG: ATP-binding protein [Gaiellaceae bacterium]
MHVAERDTGAVVDLLERDDDLQALRDAFEETTRGRGRLVLVAGEAGVGKTALLRTFCAGRNGAARVLWGASDSLFTPRALGPLLDVARSTGGDLDRLVRAGAWPHEVHEALVAELEREEPTILVVEDVHWADEATLDVLKLLGRRIEETSSLVLASYRDDELDRAHPLRLVLGELAMVKAVGRLQLVPLSPAAVENIAEPFGVNADELYRTTSGNPFFVTEVLAARTAGIPQTVRDAVLARSARLSAEARALLEAVAVAPPQAELWLLEALAGDVFDLLDECLASGTLVAEPGGVVFRHELARLAIEESTPPHRSVELHRRALARLAAPPAGGRDLARLAHHAEAARDTAAVLEFARAAAAQAASVGAHREAAAQYARAIRFSDGLPPDTRAELLQGRAWECYLTDQAEEAVSALEEVVSCYRELGDPRREGDTLRMLSNVLWCPGRIQEAMAVGLEAVTVLEQLPPGHELAMAYNGVAQLHARAEDAEGTAHWGRRALALAERLGDDEGLGYALNNLGTVEFLAGGLGARATLERSFEIAERIGHEELATRALYNLARASVRHRAFDLARDYLEAGFERCKRHNVEIMELYLLFLRARLELDQGRWAEALEIAMPLVLRERCRSTLPRTGALVVLGLVRARRGDPDVWPPLDEALAMAKPTGELPRIAMVVAARAEAAWLEGRLDAVLEETRSAIDLGLGENSSWVAYWRSLAGVDVDIPRGSANPYVLQMTGDWRGAAESWSRSGCPYEAAHALAGADDESAIHRSLGELRQLGARPAATIVARRLRERGVRDVPRGPRATTRESPAGLTARETEVLQLVADGLQNTDIARRLFLSPRTVGHHVSAILRKLEVATRGEAAARAGRLGLLEDR